MAFVAAQPRVDSLGELHLTVRRAAVIVAGALTVAACDQLVKRIAVASVGLGSRHSVTSFLSIHPLLDHGFSGRQPVGLPPTLVATVGVLIATLCLALCWPAGAESRRFRIGLALWLGAAASNLADRYHSGVVDYLSVQIAGHGIALNLADVLLALGLCAAVSAVFAWQPRTG